MNTVVFLMIRICAQALSKSVSWIPATVAGEPFIQVYVIWRASSGSVVTHLTGKLTLVLYKTDALLMVYWLSSLFVYTFNVNQSCA